MVSWQTDILWAKMIQQLSWKAYTKRYVLNLLPLSRPQPTWSLNFKFNYNSSIILRAKYFICKLKLVLINWINWSLNNSSKVTLWRSVCGVRLDAWWSRKWTIEHGGEYNDVVHVKDILTLKSAQDNRETLKSKKIIKSKWIVWVTHNARQTFKLMMWSTI